MALAAGENQINPRTDSDKASIQQAAQKLGIRVSAVYARTPNEFDAALTRAAQMGADAIDVAADPLFVKERERLVALVAQHSIPAMYQDAAQVSVGGLMSYGPLDVDVYRQAGVYVGQILKGVRPADPPVMQPTRFELDINLKTAKKLGLEVPASLLVLADDVIE
jgi:putative ABC transport system substrate-binding protein